MDDGKTGAERLCFTLHKSTQQRGEVGTERIKEKKNQIAAVLCRINLQEQIEQNEFLIKFVISFQQCWCRFIFTMSDVPVLNQTFETGVP